MDVKLRDEQVKAIESIEKNIIINAGAGTGKTEVLTRRYVHLLKHGELIPNKEVSSIVAITFTKKAAAEMKERVKNLVSESEDIYLLSMLGDLTDPNISTIDSFCGKLVRENSYYLDIDPNFTIMEEEESFQLFNHVLNCLLEKDEYKGLVLDILNITGKRQSDQVRFDIGSVYGEIRDLPIDIGYFLQLLKNREPLLNHYPKREEIVEELIKLHESKKLPKSLEDFLFLKNNINHLKDRDYGVFMEFVKMINKLTASKYDYLKSLIDLEYEFIEYELMDRCTLLLQLFMELDEIIFKEKKALGRFDFSDILRMALKLFDIPEIKEKIQSEIRYLMVDEYQDSNDLQKKLFYEICSTKDILDRNNLFVVGDPKQSIYGFRGANINVFNETLEDILKTNGELIDFRMNFRSDKRIIEPINNIYSQVMEDRYTSLDFNKDSGKSNFLIMDGEKDQGRSVEVDLTTKYILDSIKSQRGELKDFTLLFRTRSGMKDFENSFNSYGLPFYTFNSPGFYTTEEINLVIAILKLYKNPHNLISYYVILNSNIYGFSDSDILQALEERNDAFEEAQKDIYLKILALRNEKFYSNFQLLERIYKSFNIMEAFNFEREDFQAQGNLYKMLKIAKESDKNKENFDLFFYSLEDRYSTLNQQQVEDENSKVIKLMTIHGSKGLGFNKVIVPQLNKMTPWDKSLINFTKKYGIGINYYGNGFIYNKNKDVQKDLSKIEDDNIYYVAMTRAKEDLLLGVSGRNSGYKKVIYPILKEYYSNNFINTEDYSNIEVLDLRGSKKDFAREFKYIKDLESGFSLILKLNISIIMEDYNKKNKIAKIYDSSLGKEDFLMSDLTLGRIVHRFAQIYSGDFSSTANKIHEEFLIDENSKSKIDEILKGVLTNLDKKYFLAQRELNFIYRLDNCIFRGIIDNIQEFDDTIIITDYKYSALIDESLVDNYWIQLVFYGLVLEEFYKGKKIELYLINLKSNHKIKVDFNEDRKKLVKEIIIDYIYGGKIGRKDTIS